MGRALYSNSISIWIKIKTAVSNGCLTFQTLQFELGGSLLMIMDNAVHKTKTFFLGALLSSNGPGVGYVIKVVHKMTTIFISFLLKEIADIMTDFYFIFA